MRASQALLRTATPGLGYYAGPGKINARWRAMVLVIFEVLLFVAGLVFIGLWIFNPSGNYEPFVALLGLLGGGGAEFFRRLRSRSSLTPHDRQLAQSFRALFADAGHIRQYQGHDFLLPFRKQALAPLYEVVETWTDEAHYFVNAKLRKKQAAFIEAAHELSSEIVRYTVPDGNGNVSVITRDMDPENLPPEAREEAKAIDARLPAFLRTHEELLALCNKLV